MKFECGRCGQYLSAERGTSGMALPCPTCGAPVKVPETPANYFVRHWRGELPLEVSYWVNGVLGTLLITLAAKELLPMEERFSLVLVAKLALFFFAFAIIVTVWQLTGTWRSASNFGGARIWALLAKAAVIVGFIRCFVLTFVNYIPQSEEMLQIIAGDTRLPPYSIRVMPGGMVVEFRGGIRAGCSEKLEAVLSTDPQAKVLRIESPGGRIGEATKIMRAVKERGLTTYTSQECLSAATLVLMSGRQRVVGVGCKVGFHTGRLAGATVAQQKRMANLLSLTMQSAGVSDAFIARVLATPPNQLWYPTYLEMLEAGVVTRKAF